jgi:glutamate N-acetyltransferase/amino-acid N-acetyltransferase
MNLTLIALDRPTPDFAAVFTPNAFPGAPFRGGAPRTLPVLSAS